jgi:hypothetical protein
MSLLSRKAIISVHISTDQVNFMNFVGRTHEEKRNFIRMKVETPLEVHVGERELHGFCHNLSGGGLLVSLSEPLSLDTELEVQVNSHFGHRPVFRAITRVCRIHPQSPHLLGLEILQRLE